MIPTDSQKSYLGYLVLVNLSLNISDRARLVEAYHALQNLAGQNWEISANIPQVIFLISNLGSIVMKVIIYSLFKLGARFALPSEEDSDLWIQKVALRGQL